MLAESVEYSNASDAAKIFDSGVARYCNFSNFEHEGAHVDSVFVGCTFANIEWYWGLFNCAVFVECRFTACRFRGSSFSDTKFVECTFDRCQFEPDNLGKGCSNNRSKVYGGEVKDCAGGEFLFGSGAF